MPNSLLALVACVLGRHPPDPQVPREVRGPLAGPAVDEGLVTEGERELLNEIYDFNPLLFDFVFKRTVRLPGRERGFPPEVFMAREGLTP